MNFRPLISATFGLAFALAGSMAAAETATVMIPAGPGGGWDTTGRQAMQALADAGAFADGANFTNKGGAAGTVGPRRVRQRQPGQRQRPHLHGRHHGGRHRAEQIAGRPRPDHAHRPPHHREPGRSRCRPNSPHKTVADFVAALKADPGAVPVGGGSAGGVDHILLALIAKDQGADVTKINYIAQTSGAETVASVIGGSLAAGISGISEFKSFVDAGRIRILAVSSDERLPNVDAPTLKESGINVSLGNWRGVLGAPGMSAEAKKAWIDRFDQMHASDAWKKTLETQGWGDAYMSGDEFAAFLGEESTRMTGVLKDVGLVQ